MSHLNPETLARLVDEEPTRDESAHLESCAVCRAELDAMVEDVHALRMLPDMSAAPDQWDAIAQRLTAEGIIRTPERARFGSVRMMQIAAALVLFLGGTAAGRMTATSAPQMATLPAPVESASPVQQPIPAPAVLAADTQPGAVQEQPVPQPPVRSPNVSLASNPGTSANTRARTADEAAQIVRQAEEVYLAALTRYAELASQAESGDPVARLAALQSIILTTQAALAQMPADPVINGYHLTALAQRDATLRQVAAATNDGWY